MRVGYVVAFILSVVAVALGYWLSGSPSGFNWVALGFTLALLLRGIADAVLERMENR